MKDLPTWSDLNKGVRKMTDKEFEYCEEMEKRKHDEKVRELEQAKEIIKEYKTTLETLLIHKKLNKDKYVFLVEKAEAFLKE